MLHRLNEGESVIEKKKKTFLTKDLDNAILEKMSPSWGQELAHSQPSETSRNNNKNSSECVSSCHSRPDHVLAQLFFGKSAAL